MLGGETERRQRLLPSGKRISKSCMSASQKEQEREEVANRKRAGFASDVKPGSWWKVLPTGNMRLAAGA